jgi:hypothetical protein
MIRNLAYFAALAALAVAPALADGDDPPSRVARLNYQSGSVSFRPGSVEEWTPATLNYPLTVGDRLWTESASQAEMHIGSTAVRMGQTTAISILNLDDRMAQISITQGTLELHIRDLAPDEVWEIDTPNAAISLLRPGDYRIDADSDRGVTTATVLNGEAEFSGGQGGAPVPLRMGQSARILGTDSSTQEIVRAAPIGDFERWCMARDRREDQSQSVRYVSRGTIGYEDLDDAGVWRDYPPYGWVWAPRVAAGWAPYRYGHWAWVEPWGWTWIDDASWGFAPFHYGRWCHAGFGWAWVPGAMAARPVYAPALVAFIGGGGFGASAAFGGGGGVAWFPLGPREVYRPSYRVSETYVNRVNITHVNVTNINIVNERYMNQGVPGGVTAVRRDDFVHARPVGRSAVAVDQREFSQARVVGSTAPVAPLRESVMAHPEGMRAQGPPARFADRPVVARTAPPPPPVSFGVKQRALEGNQGRPLDAGAVNDLRRNAPPPAPMVRTFGRGAGRDNTAPGPAAYPQPNPRNNVDRNPPPVQPAPPRNDNPQRNLDRPIRPPADIQRPPNVVQPRDVPRPPADRPQRPVDQTDRPPANPERPRVVDQPRRNMPAPAAVPAPAPAVAPAPPPANPGGRKEAAPPQKKVEKRQPRKEEKSQ